MTDQVQPDAPLPAPAPPTPPPPPAHRGSRGALLAVLAVVVAGVVVFFVVSRSDDDTAPAVPITEATSGTFAPTVDATSDALAAMTAERDVARAEVDRLMARVAELEGLIDDTADPVDPSVVDELRAALVDVEAGRAAAQARLDAMFPLAMAERIESTLLGVYTVTWGETFRCEGLPTCERHVAFDQVYVDRDPDSDQLRMVIPDVAVMPLELNAFGNGAYGGSSVTAATMACLADPSLSIAVEFSVSTGVAEFEAGPDGMPQVSQLVGTFYTFTEEWPGCPFTDIGTDAIFTRVAS